MQTQQRKVKHPGSGSSSEQCVTFSLKLVDTTADSKLTQESEQQATVM